MKPLLILLNNTSNVQDVKLELKTQIAEPGKLPVSRTLYFSEPSGMGVDPNEAALLNLDYYSKIDNRSGDGIKVFGRGCNFYPVAGYTTEFGDVNVYIIPNYDGTVCPGPPMGKTINVQNALVAIEIQDGKALIHAIEKLSGIGLFLFN